ncbi:MAG: hemolysin family protein [Calditrichia bacterium]
MLELIIILISLILSFFYSGTETAFISANRVRVEVWRRQKSKVAEIIANFLLKPERFIYTTLVGNNIANIAFASYATIYFHQYIDEKLTWLLVTATTIIWGEIFPKTLFRSLADWLIRRIAYILQISYYLFYPMIWIVNQVSGWILRLMKQPETEIQDFFSKKDVEILIRESESQVNIDPQESLILQRVLKLRHLWVRDAMIPRADIVAVEETTSIEELISIMQKTGFTRIPVYRENLDDIIGVVILKDLFRQPESIQEIIRDVLFVPDTKRSLDLLREFKEKNITMAIVIDEYGGTAGLVTAEDLIEELVGEIEDEFDPTTVLIRKIDKNVYSVNTRIETSELKEQIGLDLPEGDYETLAGFILSRLGHIPKKDEVIQINGAKIVVTRATRRKVEWVRIVLPE